MATANTYYARPVYVKHQSDLPLSSRGGYSSGGTREGRPNASRIPVPSAYKRTNSQERRAVKNGPVNGIDSVDSSPPPPPRPPPPRPTRDTKSSDRTTPERESPHHDQATPEPKPLTKTNVTNHDQIWRRDSEDEGVISNDILAPPLQFITPETTEEMWKNFDPQDVLDSASDSSADTMIMMTTEEEKKNEERIKHSLKEYKTVKFQDVPQIQNTSKLKQNIQNGGSTTGIGIKPVSRSLERGIRKSSGVDSRLGDSYEVRGLRTIRGSGSSVQASTGVGKEVRAPHGGSDSGSQPFRDRGNRMLGGSSSAGSQQVRSRKDSENRPATRVGGEQQITKIAGYNSPQTPPTNKVTPLLVKTDNESNSSPESVSAKTNSSHTSPNEDSPDDGYGTNSSSGTSVSSPFSSSFGSVFADLSDSLYSGGTKGPILPNGAIKPNSVRESWAVKRKQRMIEAQDDSVQEQLRQLTIIEEEGAGGLSSGGNQENRPRNVNLLHNSTDKVDVDVIPVQSAGAQDDRSVPDPSNRLDGYTVASVPVPRREPRQTLRNSGQAAATSQDEDHNYVNVSQAEFARRNRQLYVIGEETRRYGSLPRNSGSRSAPVANSEINTAPVVPSHGKRTNHSSATAGSNTERIYDQVYEPVRTVRQSGQQPVPGTESQGLRAVLNGTYQSQQVRGETDSRYSTFSESGNIYVSPTGDEGFYALNRARIHSFASTSEDSVSLSLPQQGDSLPGPSSPQSPLETMSGDLLEKWSDMDRNYRNYCGFSDVDENQLSDSKVNYFQQKTLKSVYGQDNYYRPTSYSYRHLPDSHVSDARVSHPTSPDAPLAEESSSSRLSSHQPVKSHQQAAPASTHSKGSKFFQILPNMFKPSSSKKQNADKERSSTGKRAKGTPVVIEPSVVEAELRHRSLDLEQEPEYVNMQDLPQYSMANIVLENALKKGQFVSVDNLHKRPVFASSKDIQQLFSKQGQMFDSIQNPGGNRHSFHAMPQSYRYVSRDTLNAEDMRPRAASTSATMRTPSQMRSSIESRMAVLQRKSQGQSVAPSKQPNVNPPSGSVSNLSVSSNNSAGTGTRRSRLDSSGSSGGGEPKLSTLV